MKKLLLILLLFPFIGFCQPAGDTTGNPGDWHYVASNYQYFNSFGIGDTIGGVLPGQIGYAGGYLFYYNGSAWLQPGTAGSTYFAGRGLGINGTTFYADSSVVLYKNDSNIIKGYASYFSQTTGLALKVNYSDTGAMLSPYLRSSTAAATYLPISDSGVSGGYASYFYGGKTWLPLADSNVYGLGYITKAFYFANLPASNTYTNGKYLGLTGNTFYVDTGLTGIWSAKQTDSIFTANPYSWLTAATLPTTGTAGTYAYPASLTTDAYGRVTAVTAGTSAITYTAGANISIVSHSIAVAGTLPISIGGTGATISTSVNGTVFSYGANNVIAGTYSLTPTGIATALGYSVTPVLSGGTGATTSTSINSVTVTYGGNTNIAVGSTYTAGAGLSLSGTNVFSVTAVIAASSAGSGSLIPGLTYNAQGQLTGVTTYTNSPAWTNITGVPSMVNSIAAGNQITIAGTSTPTVNVSPAFTASTSVTSPLINIATPTNTTGVLNVNGTYICILNGATAISFAGTTLADYECSVNNYAAVNIRNQSAASNASIDYTGTANNGTDNYHYFDLGMNSSGWNSPTVPGGGSDHVYLYSQDDTLDIYTDSLQPIMFGTDALYRAMIDPNGNFIYYPTIAEYSNTNQFVTSSWVNTSPYITDTVVIGGAASFTITPTVKTNSTKSDYLNHDTLVTNAVYLQTPGGSPADGQIFEIQFYTSSAQNITYNSIYLSTNNITLPTVTIAGKTVIMVFTYQYNHNVVGRYSMVIRDLDYY